MNSIGFTTFSLRRQYFLSVSMILAVASGCYLLPGFMHYKIVALVLLVTVSLTAMLFDILPVLLAAMFLMYFVVALVNAVLTSKIKKAEKDDRLREEKENTLKLYSTLFNSLSHELKTPISTFIGAADNLQSMADKLSEHNKYEPVSEISKASLQLNRQVSNLLSMSRLESGFITPRLFEKFYRLRRSGTGGTGLGLSIVKGFVEAMNGSIRLENMPEGGTVFTVEIPSETIDVTQPAKA